MDFKDGAASVVVACLHAKLRVTRPFEAVRKNLFTGTEPKKKASLYKMNEQPPHAELQCLRHQIESNKIRQDNSSHDMRIRSQMKYTIQDAYLTIVPEGKTCKPTEPQFQVPTPNVVLTVEVNKCLLHGIYGQSAKERDVYQVLGSQLLTELRDKILCASDRVIPGDYSNRPDIDPRTLQTTGDMFKSGFFFIENVFYNDLRYPDNKDYSKTILAWAKKHMSETEFTTKEMSDVTFFDLNIRLGRHYLFTHQGNCEHSIVFTDMRLLNTTDYQDLRSYPVLAVTRSRSRDVCQACCTFSAK
ncbi:snRNA-activating protein complex subunit 3 [Elysia marginata]|uniref:snRNA-activating protein complex subunit 3 n=1 Tax=Elysia marginata TaxID=1093978 RepID=A0AAV4HGG6_9GAST|nr:snRNA-activating protein complex subunit 3 [Elysia marginata]